MKGGVFSYEFPFKQRFLSPIDGWEPIQVEENIFIKSGSFHHFFAVKYHCGFFSWSHKWQQDLTHKTDQPDSTKKLTLKTFVNHPVSSILSLFKAELFGSFFHRDTKRSTQDVASDDLQHGFPRHFCWWISPSQTGHFHAELPGICRRLSSDQNPGTFHEILIPCKFSENDH